VLANPTYLVRRLINCALRIFADPSRPIIPTISKTEFLLHLVVMYFNLALIYAELSYRTQFFYRRDAPT
jgi:hypothetical protein